MNNKLILTRYTFDPDTPGRILRREEVGLLVMHGGHFVIAKLDSSIDRPALERAIADVESVGVWAPGWDPTFVEPEEGAHSHLWIKQKPRKSSAYLVEFGRSLSDRLTSKSPTSLRAHPKVIGPISQRATVIMCIGPGLSLLLMLTLSVGTWPAFLLGLAFIEMLVSARNLAYVIGNPSWLLRLMNLGFALALGEAIVLLTSVAASNLLPDVSDMISERLVISSLQYNVHLTRIAATISATGAIIYLAHAFKIKDMQVLLYITSLAISGCSIVLIVAIWLKAIIAG